MRRVHYFLLVAIAWSGAFWWTFSLSRANLLPLSVPDLFVPVGGFGLVAIAGLFMFAEGGRSAVGRWLALTFEWRHAPSAYLAALLPATLLLLVIVLYGLIAAPVGYQFAPVLQVGILFGLIVAWVEEVVWRGYALPRLVERHGLVGACVVLTLVWLLFHAPLYLAPDYNAWGALGFAAWAPFYAAFTFYLGWLGASIRYSVLLPMLSHFAVNWAVAGHEPRSVENVAALATAVLLALALPWLYSRRATTASPATGTWPRK